MKVRNRPNVLSAIIMILTAALAALFFEPLTRAIRIEEPEEAQLRQARESFGHALTAPVSKEWHDQIQDQGFEVTRADTPLHALRFDEDAQDCAGRGAYMLGISQSSAPMLVSAPHRSTDRHTGTLALQLFSEGTLAAAAWNSAPRRANDACANAADLARSPLNHFSQFTLAFAQVYPAGLVVQLHGFDRETRQSQAGADADVILSNGTDSASGSLLDIADCLSATLHPRRVLVYPNDVSELGALSNAQGQALRESGFDGFVHVEMSLALREALIADHDARSNLVKCLAQGVGR